MIRISRLVAAAALGAATSEFGGDSGKAARKAEEFAAYRGRMLDRTNAARRLVGSPRAARDAEMTCRFSTTARPADARFRQNTFRLLPADPLAPTTICRVELQGRRDGLPWTKTWKFTTGT